jgi:hypothetical protein
MTCPHRSPDPDKDVRGRLRDALDILAEARENGSNADDMADCFEALKTSIAGNEDWDASHSKTPRGAHIFMGTQGQVLVISPQGDIFRGDWRATLGKEPNYSEMKKVG